MSASQQWMPVFSVIPAPRAMVSMTHPADPQPKHAEPSARHEDFYQRVGTAVFNPAGGFIIHLTAIPLNGTLIVRAPEPHETMDPTIKG